MEVGIYRERYELKKDKRYKVVSLIGNKNSGKSYILSKLSDRKIPEGSKIITKGLNVIYTQLFEMDIVFLNIAEFENALCEDYESFKFETNNENYIKLNEDEKKKVSIKDYLSEEEYENQISKFIRDKQNTYYFLHKFILNSANFLICIVNKLNFNDHKFLIRTLEEKKDKIIFVIHNLKIFSEKKEVENYIEDILLKLVSFRLKKCFYIQKDEDKNKINNDNENKIYYIQQNLDTIYKSEIFHLFMAKDQSNAGNYYNNSTIEFIKNHIISIKNKRYLKIPIIEKVRRFLFEHSEEFLKTPLENKEDLKIINENGKKVLKYTGKPYELNESYFNFFGYYYLIQSNYKPLYRAYKALYKNENGESIKLIIDIEISGKVNPNDIKIEKKYKNRQNIIIISGKRNLIKKTDEKIFYFIAENKLNCFNDENIFNLTICIPCEKFIVGSLYKRTFDTYKGLYRFIYNIQDGNDYDYIDDDYDDDYW